MRSKRDIQKRSDSHACDLAACKSSLVIQWRRSIRISMPFTRQSEWARLIADIIVRSTNRNNSRATSLRGSDMLVHNVLFEGSHAGHITMGDLARPFNDLLSKHNISSCRSTWRRSLIRDDFLKEAYQIVQSCSMHAEYHYLTLARMTILSPCGTTCFQSDALIFPTRHHLVFLNESHGNHNPLP